MPQDRVALPSHLVLPGESSSLPDAPARAMAFRRPARLAQRLWAPVLRPGGVRSQNRSSCADIRGIGGATLPESVGERRNPYHVLGLKKGATEQQIKEAYKVLARKHHPDRNPNDPGARERFIEIKEAYEALIERKTSSPVLAHVEETNAEFRRQGGYRRVFTGVGVGIAALIAAGLGFVFRSDLEYGGRRLLAWRGNAETAERWLGPVVESGGEHAASARLRIARLHLEAGDRESAADRLGDATDPLGLALLGDLHAAAGRRDQARKAYERAIARAKTADTWARAYAGLLSRGDEAAAVRVLDDAKGRFPSDPWVRWMTAVHELRRGHADAALRAVEGLELTAARAARAAALTTSARLMGDDLRALEDRRYLVDEADALLVSITVPGEFASFGLLRPGPELLRPRPFEWTPTTSLDDGRAVRDLMRSAAKRALRTVESDAEAIALAKLALDRTPSSLEGLLFLGGLHLARGSREGEAKVAFGFARTADPTSARAAAGYALAIAVDEPDLQHSRDDYDAELAAWRNALELDPEEGEWQYGYARSLSRGGRAKLGERIAADRRAIRLAPDYVEPRIDLAHALFAAGQPGDAVRVLQQATQLPEAAARAWRGLADHYYASRQYSAALNAYRNAAATDSPDEQAAAWLGVAKTYGRLRNAKEAHEAMDRATTLGRDVKPDLNDPAMQWVFQGYRPKPVELGDDAGRRAQRQGDAYYARKQYSEAYAAYYVAAGDEDIGVRARGWHGLSRCSAIRGNLHDAVRYMNNALKLVPDLPLDAKDPGVSKLLATGYQAPGKEPMP